MDSWMAGVRVVGSVDERAETTAASRAHLMVEMMDIATDGCFEGCCEGCFEG